MPYQRLKSENFQNFAGINQKTSSADLSIMEFLDISNMDFTSTGALQQRPGSATFTSAALNITAAYSYYDHSTNSFTAPLPPMPTVVQTGASFPGGQISSIFEFSNLQGTSFVVFSAPGFFNVGSSLPNAGTFTLSQLYYVTGGSFNYLLDPTTNIVNQSDYPKNQNWCFTVFVNRLFMCNGDHFYKWDGYTMTQWLGVSAVGGSVFPTAQYTYLKNVGGITYEVDVFPTTTSVYKYCLPPGPTLYTFQGPFGSTFFTSVTYTYSAAWINDRGFYGPPGPVLLVANSSFSQCQIIGPTIVIMNNGITTPGTGFSIPQNGFGMGCTGIVNYTGTTLFGWLSGLAIFRDNGPGTGRYLIGTAPLNPAAGGATTVNLGFYGAGFIDNFYATQTTPEPTCIYATLPPQYLEIYNNQMFMSGFSTAPSTVQFSDIGEPESVQPENNFDVRSNDGDVLTGMKSAFSQLFLFKNNSFSVLQGTDPTNFNLVPVSDQYGCISNRAIATYQNYLMFLDKKGICVYNGAMVQIASSKIDPIFANMNIAAAKNNAWMVHNKQRNQVWCGIPINGSTMINTVIVYDYLINAWTHFDGINMACAAHGYGAQTVQTVFAGGYSSNVFYFNPSLVSDSGATISMYAQTRYISDMGQSVEKQWRRLMMNVLSAAGATSVWNIAIYANYASIASQTFAQGGLSFQSRSDFGVSAKAISINFATATASDSLKLQGFTVESRFQRNT